MGMKFSWYKPIHHINAENRWRNFYLPHLFPHLSGKTRKSFFNFFQKTFSGFALPRGYCTLLLWLSIAPALRFPHRSTPENNAVSAFSSVFPAVRWLPYWTYVNHNTSALFCIPQFFTIQIISLLVWCRQAEELPKNLKGSVGNGLQKSVWKI